MATKMRINKPLLKKNQNTIVFSKLEECTTNFSTKNPFFKSYTHICRIKGCGGEQANFHSEGLKAQDLNMAASSWPPRQFA